MFKSKSDVLIVNLWPLTSITLILNFLLFKKIKIIVHDHQILSKSYSKEFNNHRWYLSLSLNLTYFLSNGVLAVSEAVKADLVKLGLNKKKITVINNPISLPDLSKKNINTSNNIKLWGNNAKYKILSIGSLKYEKDYLTLLKSISLISDKSNIKLAILGDGNEKQIIINSIKKLNLEKNVILPGFVPNLEDWYTSANLFVISSIHEGFGNVVAESLSYGLPVISTKSGGPVEILKNGTYGDLSPIQNAPFLSELLIKNLFNPNKRPKDKLINRAKDFDLFYISDLYIKYINKILSSV